MTFVALGGFLRTPKNPPGYEPAQNLEWGPNSNCAPDFQILPLRILKTRLISSEKSFFPGRGLCPLPRPRPPVNPTSCLEPTFLYLPLRIISARSALYG